MTFENDNDNNDNNDDHDATADDDEEHNVEGDGDDEYDGDNCTLHGSIVNASLSCPLLRKCITITLHNAGLLVYLRFDVYTSGSAYVYKGGVYGVIGLSMGLLGTGLVHLLTAVRATVDYETRTCSTPGSSEFLL